MPDRRYNDDEIAEIFQRAAEGPQGTSLQPAAQEGLTLEDLREIGREAGISPEAVDRAAKSLDVRPRAGTRKFLGLPLGVERAIDLGRRLTDEEWERLVVELREVFRARGVVSAYGSFRQWTNGNLQALLEPTANGHRFRLVTTKGNLRMSIVMGAAMMSMGTGALITAGAIGQLGTVPDLLLALFGAGYLANSTLRQPAWARLRASQMEAIIARLAQETATQPASDDSKRLPPT
jgi:hypothetical protein